MSVREEWGMFCPDCGDDEHLMLTIITSAMLRPDGTDAYGDHEWDASSRCECTACQWAGTVADASAAMEAENDLPDRCSVEPYGDGYRFHFDGDDDDAPLEYPTYIEAVRAAALIG